MAANSITEVELLEALAAAVPGNGPTEARTVQEMAVDNGFTMPRVRRALAQFDRAGRLQVHHVVRRRIDGRPQIVPAYTIASPPSSKRKKGKK